MSNLEVTQHLPANGLPPRVHLKWSVPGTALTTNFKRYRIRRQILAAPAAPLVDIGSIEVPDGYTPATVEAQHTEFMDEEPPWAVEGGAAPNGVRYFVTNQHKVTDIESDLFAGVITPDAIVADHDSWITCDAAPWLHTPLHTEGPGRASSVSEHIRAAQAQGRDGYLTRTRAGVPGRTYTLRWADLGFPSEGSLARIKAASISGRTLALNWCRGDHWYGAVTWPGTDGAAGLEATSEFFITQGPEVADYNLPAGIVLDGTADYATTPSTVDLNPAGSFTIFQFARFADTLAATTLSKGAIGVSASYGFIRSSAGTMQFWADGTGPGGGPTFANASLFTGSHVLVGRSDGATQYLDYDLESTPVATSAVAHGSITNTTALVMGANNGGASGWAALSPSHAWGYYPRMLTDDESLQLRRYLLNWAGVESAPYGAVMFIDLRDDRCWDGLRQDAADLAGSRFRNDATFISSPLTRGIPWPLAELTIGRDR